jgi:hypothetical protein
MKRALILTIASAGLLGTLSVQASLNLVQDPGFEGGETGFLTSTSTPWVNPAYTPGFTDINNVNVVKNGNPHSGMFNAVLTEEVIDSSADSAVMYQSMSLTAGSLYSVSFWILPQGTGDLTVSLNGVYVTPGVNGVMAVNGAEVYSQYSFTVTPVNNSGILSFVWSSSATPTILDLDDVSVTAVPEPTTMVAGALMLLPFAASTLRRRKKVSL